MGTRSRSLIHLPGLGDPREYADRYTRYLDKHPEALAYSEDDVAEFLAMVTAMEGVDVKQMLSGLRSCGMRVPTRLIHDRHAAARYALRHWADPAVRQSLTRSIGMDADLVRAIRAGKLERVLAMADHSRPLIVTWALRHLGRADLVEPFKAALPPLQQEWYEANLLCGRYLIHRYVLEPHAAEQQPTAAEQREIVRRIRRRELHLQSMRRNLYGLGQERKALAARLYMTDQAGRAELTSLIAELDQLQLSLAESERAHAAAMAARAELSAGQLEALETAIAAAEDDFAAALAERNAWAPSAMLAGLTIAIVGDEGREAGFRSLVESAGGRLMHVSALEKLNRIPEAVATADVIIVMTAFAKHQAEHRLRKAAPPGALFLRCPKAGLGAFERLVRTELLPRLAQRRAASGARPGGDRDVR